jgi:dCMP deaminase
MIINAGIQRIVYQEGYADALAKGMLKESGIEVERFSRREKAESVKQKVKMIRERVEG